MALFLSFCVSFSQKMSTFAAALEQISIFINFLT